MVFKKQFGWLMLIVSSVAFMNLDRFYTADVISGDASVLAVTTSKEVTLEQRLTLLEKRVSGLESKSTAAKTNSVPKESFVNLSGGSVAATDWTAVPNTQFWLDTSLYGGDVEVSWQGNLGRPGGGDFKGGVRLFDLTNHRSVDGGELAVSSGSKASFYSKKLSVWRGQNQYQIEVKSATGEELAVESPRLKVIVR